MKINWIEVFKYLLPFILGGVIVWMLIPKAGIDPNLTKENAGLRTSMRVYERLLKVASGQGKIWEQNTKLIRDSLNSERKGIRYAGVKYRAQYLRPATLYSKAQIDSVTKAIVARYNKTHKPIVDDVFDDSFDDERVVIKTAEDGIKCDSLTTAQAAIIDRGERFQASADSTMKKQKQIINIQAQEKSDLDSLNTNQKAQTKAALKGKGKWIKISVVAVLVAIAEFIAK